LTVVVGDSYMMRALQRAYKLAIHTIIVTFSMINLTSCSQSSIKNDPDRVTSSSRLKVIGNKYIVDVECWMTLEIKY